MLDPNEAVLFVAMTRDNAVWRLPFMKDGSVSKVGRFCSLFGPSGPDGMTMDARAGCSSRMPRSAMSSCSRRTANASRGSNPAPGRACTNVAIGGANRDRLYITESVTGTVLVADISET